MRRRNPSWMVATCGGMLLSACAVDTTASEPEQAAAALKADCKGGCDNPECPGPKPHAASEKADPAAAVAPAQIPIGDSPRLGAEEAEVTIVMASDFECPYCARAKDTLRRVVEAYGDRVAVVYKHSPMPFHTEAIGAAMAAEAAHRQGKFWPMYDRLFEHHRDLGRKRYVELAEQLGLDMDMFVADLDSEVLRARIERDQKLVRSLGGRGVPTFWLNGRRHVGAQPLSWFAAQIEKAGAWH